MGQVPMPGLAIMNLVTGVVCGKLIGQHVIEDEIGDPVEVYKQKRG